MEISGDEELHLLELLPGAMTDHEAGKPRVRVGTCATQ